MADPSPSASHMPDNPAARLLADAPAGDNAPAMTVSQLSAALKRTVEDGFGRVRVRGELSGVKHAASGHVYGAMKDDKALIDLVMWKGSAARLPFRPEDGLDVIATGRLTTYPGRSKYQLVADALELAGEGALMQLFERLKARLRAEGLFDRPKRALPMLPGVIGVVTSPTGAVIRDILHRLADRCPTRVIVWPVLVQGEAAPAQIAAALRGFAALPADGSGPIPRPDVVIVARGGGSIEDLWACNDEAVVRALADCPMPTISAVGHETDVTLADFAADHRAPTPTAAAEMAVPVRRALRAMLADAQHRLLAAAGRDIARGRERTQALARRLPRRDALYAAHRQRLDDLGLRLAAAPARRLALLRERFTLRALALTPALMARRLGVQRQRLDGLVRVLGSLDPRALLGRGYAMVHSADGRVVTSAAAARPMAMLRLIFADGALDVAPADAPAAPAPAHAPRRPARARPGQGDLFGTGSTEGE